VSTVLVVPSERDGHGNARIALAVPPDFVPTGCGSPVGWTCATSERGFTWERVTGLVTAEEFDLTMRVSSSAGTYLFPLSQTYDDGEQRAFAGPPASRDEAPVFTVTRSGGAAEPSPSTATAGPVRTTAPSPAASAGGAVPSRGPSPAGSAATGVTSSAGSAVPSATSSSAAAGLADLPVGRRLAAPSSGGSPVAAIALVFVGITGLGVAVLALRNRSARPPDDASP
jgi:hypothetical protein